MNKKTLWLTQTAVMLALLIVLQAVTKSFGQLVTGSCVNAVLAVCTLVAGGSSGLTVALLSPIFACVLGIAPNVVTVPAIMIGNCAYVLVLWKLCQGSWTRRIIAAVLAAIAKFAVLYALVQLVICGLLAEFLLAQGLLKQPMLAMLNATFSWPQLFTALVGGAAAILMVPVLKKALHKK